MTTDFTGAAPSQMSTIGMFHAGVVLNPRWCCQGDILQCVDRPLDDPQIPQEFQAHWRCTKPFQTEGY